MKKIRVILLVLVFFIMSICSVYATEGEVSQGADAQNTENAQNEELVMQQEKIVDTIGKVIKVEEVREVVTGTVTDKVQQVTIEIVEGDYIGEEYTTDYILSYDIDGKILAYELDVGDKVTVQITEDPQGNVIATVQDVARSNYIIGMFIVFLLSIVLIAGKQGVKAIIGLILTIVLIYFIMVKGIFKGAGFRVL